MLSKRLRIFCLLPTKDCALPVHLPDLKSFMASSDLFIGVVVYISIANITADVRKYFVYAIVYGISKMKSCSLTCCGIVDNVVYCGACLRYPTLFGGVVILMIYDNLLIFKCLLKRDYCGKEIATGNV